MWCDNYAIVCRQIWKEIVWYLKQINFGRICVSYISHNSDALIAFHLNRPLCIIDELQILRYLQNEDHNKEDLLASDV